MSGDKGDPRQDHGRKRDAEGSLPGGAEAAPEENEERSSGWADSAAKVERTGEEAAAFEGENPPGEADGEISADPEGEDFTIDPETTELEPFLGEEPQLSAHESVPQDMGTIALERFPGERTSSGGMLPLAVGATGELSQQLARMTDAEIMQRAGAGDEVCFDYLVVKYRRPIVGFLYRMVHNQAIAEELAQEVFLRVYRARASYRAEARFTTWLYRIASNMAINHARDTKHERSSSSVYLDQADEETGTTPDVADARPLAEQGMLRDERMHRIREHVAALPERQRMAVVMHKYQDMDYREIGAVLKLSESATKSLLFRAYQTLRDRLKEFA